MGVAVVGLTATLFEPHPTRRRETANSATALNLSVCIATQYGPRSRVSGSSCRYAGGAWPRGQPRPSRFERFFALRRTYFLNNLGFSPDSRHISYVHDHVFEDEGHDFSKRANQLKAYRLIAAFLFKQFGIGPEGGEHPPLMRRAWRSQRPAHPPCAD